MTGFTQEKAGVIVVSVRINGGYLQLSIALSNPMIRLINDFEANVAIKELITPCSKCTVPLHLGIVIDHAHNDDLIASSTEVITGSGC